MLNVIEKVMFLQHVDVFADIPSEQLAYLATIAEEVSFLEGEVVYREQDPSDGLYLVLDGRVHLERGGNHILSAGSEDAFGTWSLFDDEPRVVSAIASEDARLLRIDREDFVDLLADHVQITQAILKTMVKRLRGLFEKADQGITRDSGRQKGTKS